MIKIYYPMERIAREDRLRVMMDGDPMTAKSLWKTGQYEHVATYDGDVLDAAYKIMQNGVVTPSWGLEPPRTLNPIKGTVHTDGKEWGNRSAMVGDIFERGDQVFVCSLVGFTRL